MSFDWNALGMVALVGVVATAVLVGFFCGGIAAMSRRDAARASGTAGTAALSGAVACFAVSAAGVLYGLYLIIPQFH